MGCCISVFFNATQLHTHNRVILEGRWSLWKELYFPHCDQRTRRQEDTMWVPKLWYTLFFMGNLCAKHWKALAPTFMPCIYLQFTGCLTAQKFSQQFLWTGGGSSFFWWDDFLRSKPNLNLMEFFPVTSLQNIGLIGMVHYLPFFPAPNPK